MSINSISMDPPNMSIIRRAVGLGLRGHAESAVQLLEPFGFDKDQQAEVKRLCRFFHTHDLLDATGLEERIVAIWNKKIFFVAMDLTPSSAIGDLSLTKILMPESKIPFPCGFNFGEKSCLNIEPLPISKIKIKKCDFLTFHDDAAINVFSFMDDINDMIHCSSTNKAMRGIFCSNVKSILSNVQGRISILEPLEVRWKTLVGSSPFIGQGTNMGAIEAAWQNFHRRQQELHSAKDSLEGQMDKKFSHEPTHLLTVIHALSDDPEFAQLYAEFKTQSAAYMTAKEAYDCLRNELHEIAQWDNLTSPVPTGGKCLLLYTLRRLIEKLELFAERSPIFHDKP